MALTNPSRSPWPDSIQLTPSLPSSFFDGAGKQRLDFDLIHELDAHLQSPKIRREEWVKPSKEWTRVTVTSEVATPTAHGLKSPGYIAVLRRREATKLLAHLPRLAEERSDFVVLTHPVVEGIRALLVKLVDVETEGNTREILRCLRDTFLDGGWNRYKELPARELAARTLRHLAEAEEVTSEDSEGFFDQMLAMGLRPVGLPLFEIEEEGFAGDGSEGSEAAD